MLYNTLHHRWLRLIAAVVGELISAAALNLFVTLLLGLAGEEYIAAAGLALAGECLQQILLGTCTFDALFHNVVLFNVCAFLLLQR